MSTHASPTTLLRTALVTSAVLAVAACGASATQIPPSSSPAGPPSSAAAPSPSGATTSAVPQGPASTPSSSSATSASGGGGGSRCTVAHLRIRYADDRGGAGAGNVDGTLTFTNTGSAACTLTGFPGVSYVGGGNGTQVGAAAKRTDADLKTRTLAPGSSVRAALRRSQPGNYGDDCQQTKVDGFRVYPPDSTEAAFVAFKTTGCKSLATPLLQVGPVS